MKFITTLTFFLFLFFSTNAQYNKGANLLSGSINVHSQKSERESPTYESKVRSISVRPSIGTFYRANRLIGFLASFSSFKRTDVPETLTIGAGVFMRQYFPLGKSPFSFFSQEKLLLGFGKDYTGIATGTYIKSKIMNVHASVQPAFAYSVTRRLQLELILPELLSIFYQNANPTGENSGEVYASSTFSVNTGLSGSLGDLGLGLSYFF